MESFEFLEANFRCFSFCFTCSWGRNFVDLIEGRGGGVKGKLTPGKVIFIETSYRPLQLSLQRLYHSEFYRGFYAHIHR